MYVVVQQKKVKRVFRYTLLCETNYIDWILLNWSWQVHEQFISIEQFTVFKASKMVLNMSNLKSKHSTITVCLCVQ